MLAICHYCIYYADSSIKVLFLVSGITVMLNFLKIFSLVIICLKIFGTQGEQKTCKNLKRYYCVKDPMVAGKYSLTYHGTKCNDTHISVIFSYNISDLYQPEAITVHLEVMEEEQTAMSQTFGKISSGNGKFTWNKEDVPQNKTEIYLRFAKLHSDCANTIYDDPYDTHIQAICSNLPVPTCPQN